MVPAAVCGVARAAAAIAVTTCGGGGFSVGFAAAGGAADGGAVPELTAAVGAATARLPAGLWSTGFAAFCTTNTAHANQIAAAVIVRLTPATRRAGCNTTTV